MTIAVRICLLASLLAVSACGGAPSSGTPSTAPPARPSILLVTLDTTRADAIGPEARGVDTPAFNALAARGRRFRQAYATAPETLPSHTSMMTGLYPGGHGVHENARHLADTHPVVAERLKDAGYRTAAFVSSFVLARRFGLARGFDVYDDTLPAGQVERAVARDDRSRRSPTSARRRAQPLFLWVHYFDPHAPYAPAEPVRPLSTRRRRTSARSRRWTRSSAAWSRRSMRTPVVKEPLAIIVAGDHGEGLGDHGESQHGNLLYQSTMHVPLVVVGPGVCAGGRRRAGQHAARVSHDPRLGRASSAGRTACAAADSATESRARRGDEAVPRLRLAAAGHGGRGTAEGDPRGQDRGLRRRRRSGGGERISAPAPTCRAALRKALDDYPVPSPEAARAPETSPTRRGASSRASATSARARRRWCARTRRGRPTWSALFDALEQASGLFVAGTVRAGHPAARADPGGGSVQPRRGAAPGDRALVARPRRAGARGVQEGRDDRAALARRPDLPRAALRARQGLAAGGAAARAASSPRRPSACRRSRRWRSSVNVRDGSRRRSRCGRRSRRCARRRRRSWCGWGSWRWRRSRRRWRSSRSRRRAAKAGPGVHARPRAGRALSGGAPVDRSARRARSRPAVTSGVSDGALQARAGERAAEGARQRRAHRARAPARGRDDARADREGEAVSVNRHGSR